MKDLHHQLTSTGLNIAALGENILVSEFGGRILALAPDGKTNLLWINLATFKSGQIDKWRNGAEWPNLGGDRTWISPEVDTNLHRHEEFAAAGNAPDPKRFGAAYEVPRAIDPANYLLARTEDGLRLSADMAVRWLRSGTKIDLQVERRITLIAKPPRTVRPGIAFCGYTQASRLSSLTPLQSARPGLWQLLQVPGGGTITAAAPPGIHPTAWIGNPAWTRTDTGISSELRTDASFKWSLRAAQCRGRLLNLRELDCDRAGLIVREFSVAADAAYADCPPHAPQDTGHACQVYVDDGAFGGFGEMEFHSPALFPGAPGSVAVTAHTWGFIGPSSEVRALHEEFSR
ncbi:MAG: hypothetical protein V4773_07370 [Verrucomicrobiota bacterium]